jgi:hypothetical protein
MTGSAEIWDPLTRQCTATGSLQVPRADLRLVVLASGDVLAIGGRDDEGLALGAVETWNPLTGAWTERPALPVTRVATPPRSFRGDRCFCSGGRAARAPGP